MLSPWSESNLLFGHFSRLLPINRTKHIYFNAKKKKKQEMGEMRDERGEWREKRGERREERGDR